MTPPHSQPHLMFMTTPRTTIQHLIILNAAGGDGKATTVTLDFLPFYMQRDASKSV